MNNTSITQLLGIEHPIILAPMFLVSNTEMVIEALKNGITAAIPALNYRTEKELQKGIEDIQNKSDKPFGINLIVNKSNPRLKQQLKVILNCEISFVITSLGNPKEVIQKCKSKGIKVFCDVTNLKMALKVQKLGADGVIAVNNKAGGHAGDMAPEEFIPLLKKECNIPVISAGGVAINKQYKQMLELGADGLSIGTPFIASDECKVSDNYKKAIINYGAKDIVSTNKMSGSALNVINTEYVQKIGTKANLLEKILNNNKRLKNLAKLIIFNRGMKTLEKSAFSASYKTVWVAGPGIEYIKEIKPIKDIIKSIVD